MRSATSATGQAAYPVDFIKFVQAEVEQINERRKRVAGTGQPTLVEVKNAGPGADLLEVVGLSMSGGGIRSASFCLGVVQGLNAVGAFDHVDYLSTVSGGGYLGASISTTMTATGGDFVFGERMRKVSDEIGADLKDTAAVAHIRDYSNYLIPRGLGDVFTALTIILRGLVANAALVLPIVLSLAAFTVFANPARSSLTQPDFFGLRLPFLPATHFGITLLLLGVMFVVFLFWAMWRSDVDTASEFGTRAPVRAARYLGVVAAAALFEAQPFVIDGMFDLYTSTVPDGTQTSLLARTVQWATALAAPFVAAITFFRQQIAFLLKSVTTSSSLSTKVAGYAGQAALWIGGAAVPLLIWVGYLFLCYWAIANDAARCAGEVRVAARAIAEVSCPQRQVKNDIDCRKPGSVATCAIPGLPGDTPDDEHAHTPGWLKASSNATRIAWDHVTGWLARGMADEDAVFVRGTGDVLRGIWAWLIAVGDRLENLQGIPADLRRVPAPVEPALPYVLLYALGALAFLLTWRSLTPNANSLHRLYRDRLSKAFLFDPDQHGLQPNQPAEKTRDLDSRDWQKISMLSGKNGPYHLINAALNLHGSKFANRRGRNADFFLFSPLKTGSVATSYVPTTDMERCGLDLATAMAISGAAFSSNMGSSSIKALTLTLALLNVRTGYWLKNPQYFNGKKFKPKGLLDRLDLYFYNELASRLDEDSREIYVTDGGHIENLGVYELLRRRCRTIVVIDAEADAAMRFASFVTLQRYARIDLGIRILLPWNVIAASTRQCMAVDISEEETAVAAQAAEEVRDATRTSNAFSIAKGEAKKEPMGGPHVAIGKIFYDDDKVGQLLYIKSSLSGDENDYVRDYARRFGDFPHETTGDQMFSEEQFEAYRALGFHVARRMLIGQDLVQVEGEDRLHNLVPGSSSDLVSNVWHALHGQRPPHEAAKPARTS